MVTLLFFTPAVEPETLRPTVQEASPARVLEERLTLPEPATAVIVPVQVVPRPLGVATTRPEGKESVKAIPLSVLEELGLVMVKVSEVVPFSGTVETPKDFAMVGGERTLRLAVAVFPVPPFVEETALVTFV